MSGVQRLVLEDFPQPDVARSLSPNGRVHWARRNKARKLVAERVTLEARAQGLRPASGPVRLTLVWVFPTKVRHDLDNLIATGKPVVDALVRGKWLEDDDSDHVVSVTAETVYQKRRRALEIVMEEAA